MSKNTTFQTSTLQNNNGLITPGNEYYIGNDEPGLIVSFDKYIVTLQV